MFRSFTAITLCALLASCSWTDAAAPSETLAPLVPTSSVPLRKEPGDPKAEPISIRFDGISDELGLTLSITTPGDADGETTFANDGYGNIEDAQSFISGVQIRQDGNPLPALQSKLGWTVKHRPGVMLTVTYRLRTSDQLRMDSGYDSFMSPIIHDGLFHLFGNQAFLLPTGRRGTDIIKLRVDARRAVGDGQFASSFGPGTAAQEVIAKRSQVGQALYLGGPVNLTLTDTPAGRIGVAFSFMDKSVQGDEMRRDVRAVVEAGRKFFNDTQPWYLVSIYGAERGGSPINVGGGTGMKNAFAMYVASDLNFSNEEHREHFRWVLSHEYFHQWNGLTIRVASQPNSDDDDRSVYWFSEGVTEFYAMRLLTRAGLQTPDRALDVLNHKLLRYTQNSKRDLNAEAAAALFFTDADGEQIPYLRGYIAAWYADIAMRRHSGGERGLDDAMRALIIRSKSDPGFRVTTAFLASYLGDGMSAQDRKTFEIFVTEGGAAPINPDSFAPCLLGNYESTVLKFQFAESDNVSCFTH